MSEEKSFWGLVKQLPALWSALLIEEYEKRTWFGKVLYPLWISYGAFAWVVFLSFAGIIALVNWLHGRRFEVHSPVPSVYKEEHND